MYLCTVASYNADCSFKDRETHYSCNLLRSYKYTYLHASLPLHVYLCRAVDG